MMGSSSKQREKRLEEANDGSILASKRYRHLEKARLAGHCDIARLYCAVEEI